MKIVADDTIPFLKGIAEPVADVAYIPAKGFTPEIVKDADALIVRSIDKCTSDLLKGSRVRLITTATIGFDHIDIHYCESHGITWKNAPGCNAPSVAQYVMASLLRIALRRGESLQGKTLGIIGVGHVGKEVEKLASLFGMTILRNDPPRADAEGPEAFVSLEELAARADIITCHVPFTREGAYPTWHLADQSFFNQVRRGCWFINSCRGAVHDTQALLEAHGKGLVAEMILDCWENEPQISRELLDRVSIATPHIAGFSADGKATATRMCLEEIQRFFGIHFDRLGEVVPPAPAHPVINLDSFADHRIENAFLQTFDPLVVDKRLREDPSSFEWLRNHYDHPREPLAYRVIQATPAEKELLRKIGFVVE